MSALAVEKEMVDTINLQYPPEIVQYYSPNYVWPLSALYGGLKTRFFEQADIKGTQ